MTTPSDTRQRLHLISTSAALCRELRRGQFSAECCCRSSFLAFSAAGNSLQSAAAGRASLLSAVKVRCPLSTVRCLSKGPPLGNPPPATPAVCDGARRGRSSRKWCARGRAGNLDSAHNDWLKHRYAPLWERGSSEDLVQCGSALSLPMMTMHMLTIKRS